MRLQQRFDSAALCPPQEALGLINYAPSAVFMCMRRLHTPRYFTCYGALYILDSRNTDMVPCLTVISLPHCRMKFAGSGCICPAVIDPVECANGETYDNQCLAECASRATECKPIPEGKSHFVSVLLPSLAESTVGLLFMLSQ